MHAPRVFGRWLDKAWRLTGTALAFTVFGVCGTVFSLLFVPLILLWPAPASRQRTVTFGIHCFFRGLVAALGALRVMYVDAHGVAALRQTRAGLVVANHPTYLDVMVLLALTPRACCVVKNAHWTNPCFWGIVRAAGYVSNADPAALVRDGVRQLLAGYTVIVFPEGTRSPAMDRLHAFSRGFAHMAVQANASIRPVLMHCSPPAFMKSMRWYDIPDKAFTVSVRVLDDVPPPGDGSAAARGGEQEQGQERRQEQMQEQMQEQRQGQGRGRTDREVPMAVLDAVPPSLAARHLTAAVEALIHQGMKEHGFFEA